MNTVELGNNQHVFDCELESSSEIKKKMVQKRSHTLSKKYVMSNVPCPEQL